MNPLLHFYVVYTLCPGMTPSQCQQARTLLNWTPADLARGAGVSVFTVRNFEAGKLAEGRRAPTLIRRALEGAGIRFPTDDGEVRLDERSSS